MTRFEQQAPGAATPPRRIAIVIGHNAHPDHRGARAVSGAHEHAIGLVLGPQIVRECRYRGLEVRLFTHQAGDESVLGGTVQQINAGGAQLCIELHWNAAIDADGRPLANYWDASHGIAWASSEAGKRWARRLATACSDALGTTDRGEAVRASGFPMLRDTSMPSVLLETHNGLDADSHRAYLDAVASGLLARSIAGAIGDGSAG